MPRQDKSAPHRQDGKPARSDPAGMRRASLYVTEQAAAAFDAAADQVLTTLGGDTPRHVALSALLLAGAGQVDTVVRQLATQQAAELTRRLATLQQNTDAGADTRSDQ